MQNGKSFFECYEEAFGAKSGNQINVVEIGSQDVNGTLRDVCPQNFKNIGVDFIKAKNVDVVLEDPYVLPFEDNSIDIVVTSSCFEHSEFFWIVYLEIMRILKPKGLLYINAPSRGDYHRYPVDCWRFYPDSGIALSNWGKRNGFENVCLESYTQKRGPWGDFVAVILKDKKYSAHFIKKIIDVKSDYINGKSELLGEKILNKLNMNNGDLQFFIKFIPKFIRKYLG
jgi:SAM-dependent methyltransferase